MLLHQHRLDEEISGRRQLGRLRPNQLFRFGILRISVGLPQTLKQSFDQILFFWRHKKNLLISTVKSRVLFEFRICVISSTVTQYGCTPFA
jgi:hypothetical protein